MYGGHTAEAKKQRTDRYRPIILYMSDSEDESTSNSKLEKTLQQGKERTEKKAKTPVPSEAHKK